MEPSTAPRLTWKEYQDLLSRAQKFDSLVYYGVDNWETYDDAMEYYRNHKED